MADPSSDTGTSWSYWEHPEPLMDRVRSGKIPIGTRSSESDEYTLLMSFAVQGDVTDIEYLLSAGEDVNAVDGNGRTALMHASTTRTRPGAAHRIRCLLAHGAHLDVADRLGRVALTYAATCSSEAVACLLEHGPDVSHVDNRGRTAFQCAVQGGYIDAVVLLINHGAEVVGKNTFGQPEVVVGLNVHDVRPLFQVLLASGGDIYMRFTQTM